jgi:hypothetical protein
MYRIKAINLALIIMLTANQAFSQNVSDAWPRLPDGREVIDILGVQLAFPQDMAATTTVDVSCDNCSEIVLPKENFSQTTIKSLLADPVKTKAAFSATSGTVRVRLAMNAVPVKIKGKIKKVQGFIDIFSPAKTEWNNVKAPCHSENIANPKMPFHITAESTSPPYTVYCTNANERLFKTKKPIFVHCSQISSEQCSITTLLNNARIQTSYKFFNKTNEPNQVPLPYLFPQEEWLELDKELQAFNFRIVLDEKE